MDIQDSIFAGLGNDLIIGSINVASNVASMIFDGGEMDERI